MSEWLRYWARGRQVAGSNVTLANYSPLELKKAVCQRKGGKKQLYALSDDCKFVCDCETAGRPTFTFQEETDHTFIERLPSVDPDAFRDEVEHLTRDLQVWFTLVQCYLGDISG